VVGVSTVVLTVFLSSISNNGAPNILSTKRQRREERPLQADHASTRLIGPTKSIFPTSTPLWRRMA
jgi:hypothetical protein